MSAPRSTPLSSPCDMEELFQQELRFCAYAYARIFHADDGKSGDRHRRVLRTVRRVRDKCRRRFCRRTPTAFLLEQSGAVLAPIPQLVHRRKAMCDQGLAYESNALLVEAGRRLDLVTALLTRAWPAARRRLERASATPLTRAATKAEWQQCLLAIRQQLGEAEALLHLPQAKRVAASLTL